MHYLVHDLCADQHLFQIHCQCLSQTRHSDYLPIHLCFILVSGLRLACVDLSWIKDSYSSAQEWHTTSFQGSHCDGDAIVCFSVLRSSTQLYCYGQNSRVAGPYHQRALATFHRPGISVDLSHTICSRDLFVVGAFDSGGDDRLLHRLLRKFHRHSMCFFGSLGLCGAKHILEEII